MGLRKPVACMLFIWRRDCVSEKVRRVIDSRWVSRLIKAGDAGGIFRGVG